MGCLVLTSSAFAGGGWLDFADETATRIAADASITTANGDEKDFIWGDLDADGDTDLISVHKQLGTTEGRRRNVLLMNENGVLTDRTNDFATASTVPGSSGFLDLTNDRDVILVDVNGDGWDDIVTATTLSGDQAKYISHPRIYINLGETDGTAPPLTSTWLGFVFDDADRIPTFPDEPRFCSVNAGDLDNDGDQDLFFGDYQQGGFRAIDLNYRVAYNDGTGYYTDVSTTVMTADQRDVSFGMASEIFDFNNDGVLDIIVDDALSSPTAVSIIYNDPDDPGDFTGMPRDFIYGGPAGAGAPYHIDVGELNNDGILDVVITDDGFDRYILGTGVGGDGLANFASSQILTGSTSNEFGGNNLIVDLNNDGFNDVIIANVDVDIPSCTQFSKIFRNFGVGGDGFSVTLQEDGVGNLNSNHLRGLHDVAVFDIDGDGWNDMVFGGCNNFANGMVVYMNQPPTGLVFSYPAGFPSFVTPGETFDFQVRLEGFGGDPAPDSASLFLSVNGGAFQQTPLSSIGTNLYEASIPAGECLDSYAFYFSGQLTQGGTFFDPPSADASPYTALATEGTELTYSEDVEDDTSEWTVVNDPSLSTGAWEAADPNGTILPGNVLVAPEDDAEASIDQVKAFVTENGAPGGATGAADVDGGPTFLISPIIDLADTDATISYFVWFFTNGLDDQYTIEVANDGDQPSPSWQLVEGITASTEGWEGRSFTVSDFVEPTANVRVRFSVIDTGAANFVEGGLDLFNVDSFVCAEACFGDTNSSGAVDVADLLTVLGGWGTCPDPCVPGEGNPLCTGDIDLDCIVGVSDLLGVLGAWGPCE